jgi:hypothetical protein
VIESIKKWWKLVSVIVSMVSAIGGGVTALNLKIHDAAKKEISAAVHASVKDAMGETGNRLTRAENLLIAHEGSIARLQAMR